MNGKKEYDNTVVSECYDKYYQSIFRFCRVRLGELSEYAEDCTQETFLIFQNKLKNGENILQPRAYLYKVADNVVKDTIKKAAKHRSRSAPLEAAENTPSAPIIPDKFDYDKCAAMLIALLEPGEQDLYRMKYKDELPINEIADRLNITSAAAAKRISRLRKKIIDLIKEKNLFGNEVTL